uniref:Uncharacterized protein n=1 Tax=Opuntia streptacantha TaxID=393608 RepID=A0A7C8YMY8_OPUST
MVKDIGILPHSISSEPMNQEQVGLGLLKRLRHPTVHYSSVAEIRHNRSEPRIREIGSVKPVHRRRQAHGSDQCRGGIIRHCRNSDTASHLQLIPKQNQTNPLPKFALIFCSIKSFNQLTLG